MNQRGIALLEALVAAAALSVVLLAVSSFFLTFIRFGEENSAQTFLQRQAMMIKDEIAKQIQAGSLASLTTGCPAYPTVGDANALQITNANDPTGTGCGATNSCNYCFHRDSSFTRLLEENPGGQRDLLSGAAATLSVTTGGCPGSGGFCPSLITNTGGATVAVAITFRLRFGYPETSGFQTMTFTTTVTPRNP